MSGRFKLRFKLIFLKLSISLHIICRISMWIIIWNVLPAWGFYLVVEFQLYTTAKQCFDMILLSIVRFLKPFLTEASQTTRENELKSVHLYHKWLIICTPGGTYYITSPKKILNNIYNANDSPFNLFQDNISSHAEL